MRIHNILDRIINHEIKTKTLRFLCKTDTGWTGRQLAKELGISPTTAHKFLKELIDEGIVNVKGVGKSYYYTLNSKSYIVKNLLRPFFEKEEDILNVMMALIRKTLLKSNVKIESCGIFGSIAQKRETEKSDIDLLIIIDSLKDKRKVEDELDNISTIIAQSFQTVISPFILSIGQFTKKHREKAPIVSEILKSYILIMGKSLERIIL